MADEGLHDLTYAEALAAAAPRIADLRTSLRAQLDQILAAWQDSWAVIRAWMAQLGREIMRLWQRIARWIGRQGPCPGIYSPALAYATPAMRRRAAKQRAHLVTRAHVSHV